MIPSPMYATSVPPWSRIASLISLRYLFSTSITSPGASDSANEVKPRRSLNITVPSRCTPPRRNPASVLASTSSTTSSGTKRENMSRTRSRSNAVVT